MQEETFAYAEAWADSASNQGLRAATGHRAIVDDGACSLSQMGRSPLNATVSLNLSPRRP